MDENGRFIIISVDDEPDLEIIYQHNLRHAIREKLVDYKHFCSSVELVEYLSEHPHFDLVISDINMPELDGFGVLKKLKNLNSDALVYIISAYGNDYNKKKSLAGGAKRFITKPIDFKILKEKINQDLLISI